MNTLEPTNSPEIHLNFWFKENAIEAANYYVSIIPNSKILHVSTMMPNPETKVEIAQFELAGKKYSAMSSSNPFEFNEATSLMIQCKNQEEINYYWEHLGKNGKAQSCGWLKDCYGVSWQIIPSNLGKLLGANPNKQGQIMQCFLGMQKIEIADLQAAAL
jgi:predicted 3-demethylubiquinone-9 3-methyltransferase (glyoxalase superfamily)